MSDLICRKTMMRCQTPGMCAPFGGCNMPGTVSQSDHDRIVAGLESQRAMWVANATELGIKCDQLAERCRELEADYKILLQYEDAAIRDEAKYLTEIDTLRTEGAQARGAAEYWKAEHLAGNAEIERLQKDADLFRRLRNLPDELLGAPGVPCVAVPDGPRAGRYVSGTDLDAALEASR